MRKIYSLIVAIALVTVCLAVPGKATADTKKAWPKGPKNISAASAVVIDMKSGMVLYEKNKDAKRYPASITKIMTTLVALENSSLNETVKYSKTAVLNLEAGASNAGIQVGEKLSMEQSLYAVMLRSANEACNGVAEHISGSIKNFVKQMNAKAQSLGCKNTHFNNTNGLWQSNHYTTAYDMAIIMKAAMRNPMFRTLVNTRRYDLPKSNKRKKVEPLIHHHAMVFPITYPQYGYDYCIGGKTGYTSKSQATLVTAAKKGNMELVCVVMKTKSAVQGEPNIYTDTIKLFNYCFEKYKQYDLNPNESKSLSSESMFTKFSPFYDATNSGLQFDGQGSVVLPNGVSLKQTTHNVDFYDEPVVKDGKRYIGKLTYYYNKKEAGGAEIMYNEPTSATLKDSIDMNEWFEEAVEKANTPDFPWKTVLLLILLSAVGAAVIALIILRIRVIVVTRRGKRHFKRLFRGSSSHPTIWHKRK